MQIYRRNRPEHLCVKLHRLYFVLKDWIRVKSTNYKKLPGLCRRLVHSKNAELFFRAAHSVQELYLSKSKVIESLLLRDENLLFSVQVISFSTIFFAILEI